MCFLIVVCHFTRDKSRGLLLLTAAHSHSIGIKQVVQDLNPAVLFGISPESCHHSLYPLGTAIRWIKGDASLLSYSGGNCTANLSFSAFSLGHPRTLQIYSAEGNKVNVSISTGRTDGRARVELKKGLNQVKLHVIGGCDRPVDIPALKSEDARCVSIAFNNISLS